MIAAALATVTVASAAVILMSRPVTSAAHQGTPPRPDRHLCVQSPEARRLLGRPALPFGVFTSSAMLRPTMSRAWACRITRLRIRCTFCKLAVARSDAAAALQPMAQRCDLVFVGTDEAMRGARGGQPGRKCREPRRAGRARPVCSSPRSWPGPQTAGRSGPLMKKQRRWPAAGATAKTWWRAWRGGTGPDSAYRMI